MKFKFSFRLFFILFTIAIVVFGIRYTQRRNLQLAAEKVQQSGGTIFYRWQAPYMIEMPTHVQNAYWTVEVPYTVTGPDGQQETKFRTETGGRNIGFQVDAQELRPLNSDQPGFSLLGFLLGTHDDVSAAAVSIPATAVDESTVKLLQRLTGLESIILRVDPRYFAVQLSNRSTPEQRKKDEVELGRDLKRASTLIEERLPKVKLHRRGLVPSVR